MITRLNVGLGMGAWAGCALSTAEVVLAEVVVTVVVLLLSLAAEVATRPGVGGGGLGGSVAGGPPMLAVDWVVAGSEASWVVALLVEAGWVAPGGDDYTCWAGLGGGGGHVLSTSVP